MRGLGTDDVSVVGPTGVNCSYTPVFVYTVESLSFFYLLFISQLVFDRILCIEKLGIFHANQTSICLEPHLE